MKSKNKVVNLIRNLLWLVIVVGGIYLIQICCSSIVPAKLLSKTYFVAPEGNDKHNGSSPGTAFKTIQKALQVAQAGETVTLAPGTYDQDFLSVRSGRADAPITLTGPVTAILKGGGAGRIIEINHDYFTLSGFTVDGFSGVEGQPGAYRDKLIYLLGGKFRKGVTGVRVLGMTLKNAGGECIRLRYFAQKNEIAQNTISGCGRYDFVFSGGGKNGEGIYIGTAPEQLGDGKNPTAESDESNNNWVHHNIIDTEGNECIDIKEGASGNLVENNSCTGQKDPESGGMSVRGNYNTFRLNTIAKNIGAGIRLGGDGQADGIYNDIYENTISENLGGGIKIQRSPQGSICSNKFSKNKTGILVGTYKTLDPTRICPDDIKSSASIYQFFSAV